MAPKPTNDQLATERTEELSRFESEGGSTEHITERREESRTRGLEPRASDHRGRILIAYAAREHHTYVIADVLAVRLRRHGFTVEIGDTATGTMPPPQDYDVVIIGMPMTFGHESESIATYIEHNREALTDVASGLFTVSKSGTLRDQDPGGFLEQFLRRVDWVPNIAAAFAGGEPFPREGLLLRLATRIGYPGALKEGGALRTNWTDVQHFADSIATELANAAVIAERSEPHDAGQAR